ncbi:MAG: hypothetical protein QM724_07245 [Flavobacteriales bacterium]
MNNARHCPVHITFTLILWSAASVALAQDDPSLTKDFPHLSPKERSRIAARETAEAQEDQVYQAVMHEAEQAFQEGRYEDALAGYGKARVQRPYNIYPKVKIQDLQALLKRRAEEQATAPPGEGEAVTEEPVPIAPPQPPPSPVAARPAGDGKATKAPSEDAPSPAPQRQAQAAARPTEARTAPPAGMEERCYRDGQAFVIERTIAVDGRRVVYKRVAHPHGQVFFFEDGISVSERVWNERFP